MIILKPCQIVIYIYIYKECADMCEWFVNNNLSIHFLEDESKCILFSKENTCSSFTWHTITIE